MAAVALFVKPMLAAGPALGTHMKNYQHPFLAVVLAQNGKCESARVQSESRIACVASDSVPVSQRGFPSPALQAGISWSNARRTHPLCLPGYPTSFGSSGPCASSQTRQTEQAMQLPLADSPVADGFHRWPPGHLPPHTLSQSLRPSIQGWA